MPRPANARHLPASRPCPASIHSPKSPSVTVVAVDAAQNTRYLKDLVARVQEFRVAYSRFLDLCKSWGQLDNGVLPYVKIADDTDPEDYAEAESIVSRAAGRLLDVPRVTGLNAEVAGKAAFDPFAGWITITQRNPRLIPADIFTACDQALGRLEALQARADAEAPLQADTESMHPLVWGAARGLWHNHHYREAVAAAAGAVVEQAKSLTGRNDIPETALWQETFSDKAPLPEKPRLRWPGDPKDQTVKSMNEGLRHYSSGVQLTIRNPAVHEQTELTAEEATERLAALSLLARWIERCTRVEAAASESDNP
jgi:uncharacterized protein (TIGR02391 family)